MPRYPKGSTGNVRKPQSLDRGELSSTAGIESHGPRSYDGIDLGDGAGFRSLESPSGSSDSRAAEALAGNPAGTGATPEPTTKYVATYEESPMTIKFTSVTFHHEMARLAPLNGLATQSTVHFDTTKVKNLVIEFNPATQLVRMAIGTSTRHVPASEVLCFGPTVEEAAQQAEELKQLRAKQAADNARAAAEAEELAQRPATA